MTQFINAVSLTTRVLDWLAQSKSPQILHLFDRACNLINENREVLSVVAPEIGNGPFNLVIEDISQLTNHITIDAPLHNTPTELHIGNFIIETRHARRWDPHPDWKTLHAKRDTILRQVQRMPDIQSPVVNLQFSNSLSSAILLADSLSCTKAAQELAGLGQGLTPAGDDYIIGGMYAAWIIHPRKVTERIAREIAETAAPLTTSLSAAWLLAAGHGEAGIMWHTFFDALLSGERSAIDMQTSNILSIGATSGEDALAGFIDTFISYAESESKHVISE